MTESEKEAQLLVAVQRGKLKQLQAELDKAKAELKSTKELDVSKCISYLTQHHSSMSDIHIGRLHRLMDVRDILRRGC